MEGLGQGVAAMVVQARVENGQLVVRLPWRLALAAGRRTLRVPAKAVKGVRVEPDWWRALYGEPGRHYRFRPERWCVGELRSPKRRHYVALLEEGPALVIDLWPSLAPYTGLSLTVADPHGTAALLRTVARPELPQRG